MTEKTPHSDFGEKLNGLSEKSLDSETIQKLTNLGVTRETATKLAGLREEMDSETQNSLQDEFEGLSAKELDEKINRIQDVLLEHRKRISDAAAFETSKLRETLNYHRAPGENSGDFRSSQGFFAGIKTLGSDFGSDLFRAIAHPIDSVKSIVHEADRELTVAELEYEIPESIS